MQWRVEIASAAVEAELDALEPTLKARFLHICGLLEAFGPQQVGAPHVRHLIGKLREIRMRGKSGIARAIYLTVADRRILVVHAFVKKSQKTPRDAISVAVFRSREFRDE